jgi:hypothetical protein
VDALRAADETHAGEAVAPLIQRFVRGLAHLGMLREAEVVVNALRAADEAHARQAVAPMLQRLMRRLPDLRMLAEAEVIVRAHVRTAAPPLARTSVPCGVESTRSRL